MTYRGVTVPFHACTCKSQVARIRSTSCGSTVSYFTNHTARMCNIHTNACYRHYQCACSSQISQQLNMHHGVWPRILQACTRICTASYRTHLKFTHAQYLHPTDFAVSADFRQNLEMAKIASCLSVSSICSPCLLHISSSSIVLRTLWSCSLTISFVCVCVVCVRVCVCA